MRRYAGIRTIIPSQSLSLTAYATSSLAVFRFSAHNGEFDPTAFEVNIYTQHLLSEHDRDLTLLHEFIHARDDHKGLPNIRTCSPQVEREAEVTYQQRPGVLALLIKELYGIKAAGAVRLAVKQGNRPTVVYAKQAWAVAQLGERRVRNA